MKIDNLYSPENVELTHYLNQALKAKELFKRDRDYLVREGQVIIIDEFTGELWKEEDIQTVFIKLLKQKRE